MATIHVNKARIIGELTALIEEIKVGRIDFVNADLLITPAHKEEPYNLELIYHRDKN